MSVYVPQPVDLPAWAKAGPQGPGAGVLLTEYLMPMMLPTDAAKKIRMSLTVGRDVSWIRAAERVISGKIGGDPDLQGATRWHLEDPDGESIDEDYADKRAVEALTLLTSPAKALDVPGKRVAVAQTQSQLWEITSRHMGLAGVGYWFLDQLGGDGIPRATLYIRPDRLMPGIDTVGNLTNWWLDARDPARPETGTRLELGEVMAFWLETPTDGWVPPGLIESCILKAQVNGQIDKYLGSLLGSSGKLSGMLAPKTAAIENDVVWDQFVRDTRNIAEQPDAAKRLQLMRAPMEYTRTQATVAEMAIIDLMTRSRDELLALWGVPLSQVGGSSPAGLNSGDIRKYDEAALWQNAVVMRLVPMKQLIQTTLLDRWVAYIGWAPKLVLDIPEFDDDSPRYDKIQKSMAIAMTNDERRGLVNHDPFDPSIIGPTGQPLGQEVWMLNTASPVGIPPTGGAEPDPTRQALALSTPAWSAYKPTPPAIQATSGIPDKGPERPNLATMAQSTPAGGAGATLKAKLAKDDPRVNYRAAESPSVSCAACRFMRADGGCDLVTGQVQPTDVCDLFAPAGKAKVVKGDDVIPAVLAALKKQWPASELDIVRQGSWKFDPAFPIRKINAERRPIARNPKIVAGAEAVLSIGAPISPITIIHTKRIGKPGYEPIDGWHRVLAAEHAGIKKIPAYVGEGDDAWTAALIKFDDDIPTPPDSAADEEPFAKASFREGMASLRANLMASHAPKLQLAVAVVRSQQKRDILSRVAAHYDSIKAKPRDRQLWWDRSADWDARLAGAMRPVLQSVASTVRDHVTAALPRAAKADPVVAPQGAVAYVLARGAARVSGINQTVQDELALLIAEGIASGLGPAELGDAIEGWSGWDEYAAERIATTEMAAAYNAAAIGSYDESGVTQVQAVDGEGDAECAARNDQVFDIGEADSIEDHPNGTLAWDPVIGSMGEP